MPSEGMCWESQRLRHWAKINSLVNTNAQPKNDANPNVQQTAVLEDPKTERGA